MDGSKDEALQCLHIGREAFESGDTVRALKSVAKARRLDPLLPVDDLFAPIGRIKDESCTSSQSKPPNSSSLRHRFAPGGTVAYTEEQAAMVRQINGKKDYYDILGLQKNCTVGEVGKAYRKLSLKVHPDKNKAPGSEEAFKSLLKAFQCLSDKERGKRHDMAGSEERVNGRQSTRYRADGLYGAPDDDCCVLPPLLLVLIVLVSFLIPPPRAYCLSGVSPYKYRFVTQRGATYYVMENFEREFPPESKERASLENEVDSDYDAVLESECRLEIVDFHLGFDTPHCDMLKQFRTVA